jgi:hypothetical protein
MTTQVLTLTDEQQDEAIRLRASGLSYPKVALAMNADAKCIWLFFHPKPPPKPLGRKHKKKPQQREREHHVAPSSVPMMRHINRKERQRQQPTKSELHAMLYEAVMNTLSRGH